MREVKFTSNTIRENQDIINENFNNIETTSQEISNNIKELKDKLETIPTKTSQLTNDGDGNSNFATINDVNQAIEDIELPDNIATTDYVNKEISDLVNSAPETLNTLGELASAIEENESIIDALNNAIAYKASKSEIPTKTSQLQNNGNGTSKFATESYVAENGGKIDSISVNNVRQPITNKNVNIKMPTKTSELTNDGDGSSIYSTKTYVDDLFNNVLIDYEVESIDNGDGTQIFSINGVHDYTAGAFRLIYVNSLPTENIDKNAIYLLLAEKPKDGNKYTEYVYINEAWETIGETDCLKEFDGSKEVGDLQHTLYGQDLGVQKNIPYTSTPTRSAIAQYTNNATLKVAEPVDENDVTTKKYVDDIAHSLSGQNEYIGRYTGTTYTIDTIQQELANFVQTTAGREQKKGDLVNINSVGSGVDYSGQQWIYNGTIWQYYIDFENHNVVDNLNSDSAVDPLSAKQGKVLNEKFNNYALTSYVDNEVTGVRNNLNSLTERVDGHDERLTTINSGINTLEQGLNTANGRIDELNADINTLEGNVDRHEESLTALNDEVSGLNGELDTVNENIEGLNNDLNALDGKVDTRVNTFHATIDNSNFRYVKGSADFTYEQVVNTENCQIEVSVANEKVYLKKQEFKNINPPDSIAGRYVGFSEVIRTSGEYAELFLFVYDPENLPTDSASVENLEGWGDVQYCVSSYQPVVMGNFLDTDVEANRTNDKNAPSTKAVGDYTDKQCGVVLDYMQTTFANNLMTLIADQYAPHIIYNNSTGFEASNNNAGATWHLTGLDLSPYKRIKCYVCGAGDSNSNYTPAHVVEIHLDDRAKGSFGYYSGGHGSQNPNNDNRIHFVQFIVNAEKNSIQFQRSQSLYGTAITASVGGRRCYLIEGYKN